MYLTKKSNPKSTNNKKNPPQAIKHISDHYICIKINVFSATNIKSLVHLYSAFPKWDLPVLWTVLSDVATEFFFCVKCWEDARIKVEGKSVIFKGSHKNFLLCNRAAFTKHSILQLTVFCHLQMQFFLTHPLFSPYHTQLPSLKKNFGKTIPSKFSQLD